MSEIDNSDYYFLLELFNKKSTPKEEKQSPLGFFGTVLSPQDLARAKGEIE